MILKRKCTKCGLRKRHAKFYKAKKGKDGLRAMCKKCCNKASTAWQTENRQSANANMRRFRQNNPEKARLIRKRAMVRKVYGITLEEYNEITAASCCEICGTKIRPNRKCLDHDHVTGKIRGLLCNGCNTGIGFFKENPEVMEAAADYIRRHADS